ncbi:hypothetical protein [Asticcacaulis solisilvae]|uniref:hypothetical protein n=1 Tax=Asticcacaulis solisilvae TaxID=1217274 RepID=UPI003FD76B01
MPRKHIILPGAVTGHSHGKCYANIDGNCSPTISREHYISANYLRSVEKNGGVKISGLAWQQPETFDLISVNALQAKVLCSRHNSAISNLDDEFRAFTEVIRSIDGNAGAQSTTHSFSGNRIELWMLKTLLGLALSGNLRGTVDQNCVELLLARTPWPRWWGLYFSVHLKQRIYHT